MKRPSTQVWSAEEAGGPGKSLYFAEGRKVYKATGASNKWSLHFSLVNTAATDAIQGPDDITKGYAGCVANLAWLKKKESD